MYSDDDEEDIQQYVKSLEMRDKADVRPNYDDEIDDQTKHTLLPSIQDPSLWMVRCKPGDEKKAIITLLNKQQAYKTNKQPLQILSATTSFRVKGYLYIEAFKEHNVREAIKGLNVIFQGKVT